MLTPAWRGVPVAAGRPQRKQSATVLACSSFLSNKVQREAMLYIKRPKLPLPPHGFHTYEVEYERKTTVTSSIIYLVADVWLHSNCSSISLLPNKPNSVALIPVGLTCKMHSSSFVSRLLSSSVWTWSDIPSFSRGIYKLLQKTRRLLRLCRENTSPEWNGGKPGCCSSLVLISLNLMRWSTGLLVAPASQFNGYVWDNSNVMMFCAYDPEDVSVLADNNRGVKEDRLGWGLRRDKLTSTQTIGDVICSCQVSRRWRPFGINGGFNSLLNKSQHSQKHDRFKHGGCLFRHLFCHWREQVAKDSLCVCGLWTWTGKCKDKDRLDTSFPSFNYSYVRRHSLNYVQVQIQTLSELVVLR